MVELETNLEEIRIALKEIGVDVTIEQLENMDEGFLISIQERLFDIKRIKKEMQFIIDNNEILRNLIMTFKEKFEILDGTFRRKDDAELEA